MATEDVTDRGFEIPETLVKPIVGNIEEAITILEEKKDIRLLFGPSALSGLIDKMRIVPDFGDTPQNRFATYVVWTLLLQTDSSFNFNVRTKGWFETNADNLEEFRAILKIYLDELKKAFETMDYEGLLNASKDYLYNIMVISKKFIPIR